MCHSSGSLPRVWLFPPEYKRLWHHRLAAAHLKLTEAKAVSDITPTMLLPSRTHAAYPNYPSGMENGRGLPRWEILHIWRQ